MSSRVVNRAQYRSNSFAEQPHRPLHLRNNTVSSSRGERNRRKMELPSLARRLRAQNKLTSSAQQELDKICALFFKMQFDMIQYENDTLTAHQALLGIKTQFNELLPTLKAREAMLCQRKPEIDEVSNIIVQLRQQYCSEREIQRLMHCQQRARRLAEKAWLDMTIYQKMSADYHAAVLDRYQLKHQQYSMQQLHDDFANADKALAILQGDASAMEYTATIIAKAAEQIIADVRESRHAPNWEALNARLDRLDDWFNEDDDAVDEEDDYAAAVGRQHVRHISLSHETAARGDTPDSADLVRKEEEENGGQGNFGGPHGDVVTSAFPNHKHEGSAAQEDQSSDARPRRSMLGASFSAIEDQIARRGHVRASTVQSNYAAVAAGPPQLGSVVRRNGRSVPRIFTGSFDELEESLQRLRASAANTPNGSSRNVVALASQEKGKSNVSVRDFATPEAGTPNSSIPSTPTIYLRRRKPVAAQDTQRSEQETMRSLAPLGIRPQADNSGNIAKGPKTAPDPRLNAPARFAKDSSFTEPPSRANSLGRRSRQREHTL